MKWDVKHDRAKKVIDRFLDNAGYWQESEDLVAGLADEEKELVNAEVELMIASIRKRYKLQERLPFCGGSWRSTSLAGVFGVSLSNPRTHAYGSLGFRSAYFRKMKTK